MTTKTLEREDLFRVIQSLPEDKAMAVWEFVQSLQNEDDEPLSEEDLAALNKAEEDVAAGRFYTLEEFNKKMADLP